MFGLTVSDPTRDAARREPLSALLHSLDIPLSTFTEEPAPPFTADMSRAAFLRAASWAVLLGQPLPLDALLTHLSTPDPLPANVLRKYLFLRWSLTPYWHPGRAVTPVDGGYLWGDALLILPVSPEDAVDAPLPPGVWTELTGACHTGHLRCMRGYKEMPVLVRENTLLPISMNGQSPTQTTGDDADRLTLHWFQPKESAECLLADGTCYHVQDTGGQIGIRTNITKPFHLIIHRDGMETLVR